MKVIMVETDNGWEYVRSGYLDADGNAKLLTTPIYGKAAEGQLMQMYTLLFPNHRFELKEISE